MRVLTGLLLVMCFGNLFVSCDQRFGHNANKEQRHTMTWQLKLQNYLKSKHDQKFKVQRRELLQCFSCENAVSNEECNAKGLTTCQPTQTSCQTEIRVFNPRNRVKVRIKKGCKQDLACGNNYVQNNRTAWPSTQCNYIPRTLLSVCRYCCTDNGCNRELPEHICKDLNVPDHASMTCSYDSGLRSSTCSFTCDPCYKLKGSRVRMCLTNKMWSGVQTKCIRDDRLPGCDLRTTCDARVTKAPEHGSVECSDYEQFGSECRFMCHSGYVLIGKRVLRCLKILRDWDGEMPTCVAGDDSSNPCHPYAMFEYAPDGQLSCDCSTGFTGDGFITCDDIDECLYENDCDKDAFCINTIGSYRCQCKPGFNGDGYECGDVNECVVNLDNCDPVNGICINEIGRFKCMCAPEYTGDGVICTKLELTCSGILEGDICIQEEGVVERDFPGDTSPMEEPIEENIRRHREKVTTEGEDPTDYKTIGSETDITTTMSKSVSSDPESCVKMVKGRPIIVRDAGVYEKINEELLRKLMVTHNNTRSILGPWIGLDDRAEPGVLRWRDGKKLDNNDFQSWAPGQPRMLDSEGFGNCVNLVSDPVGHHTQSFLWKITLCSAPIRYICETEKSDDPKISLCVPLTKIANGRIICTNGWLPGSSCVYDCNLGYVLRGDRGVVTCQDDLTWNDEPPVCVRAICERPLLPPTSGKMQCTNGNKEGSICAFTCNERYRVHGNETVTCQRNLKWSSQRPCCRDDCPPYARMNLILVLDSSTSIGAVNFLAIKRFVKQLHRRFVAAEDFTHISAITFSSDVQLINDVQVFKSNDEFDIALDALEYIGNGTLTGKAIDYVTHNLIRKREGAHDIVVLLTDGMSYDDIYRPAADLHNTGTHVVAVGVRHAWRYQLHIIASKPTDMNVVEVDTFDDLNTVVRSISAKVCHFQC